MNQDSRQVNKYDRFFSTMRQRNREKFDYIDKLGEGNLVKGFRLYETELNTMIDGFIALYNELEYKRLVDPFTKQHGYKSCYIAHTAIRIEEVEVRYLVRMRLPIIIEQMKEFLKEKGIE